MRRKDSLAGSGRSTRKPEAVAADRFVAEVKPVVAHVEQLEIPRLRRILLPARRRGSLPDAGVTRSDSFESGLIRSERLLAERGGRSVCRQLRPFPGIGGRANVDIVFIPHRLTSNTLARAGRGRRQWRAQNAVDECVSAEDVGRLCLKRRGDDDMPCGRANVSVCTGVPKVDRLLKVFASDSQTSVPRHRPDIHPTEAVQGTQVEPAMRNVHVRMKAVVRVIGVSLRSRADEGQDRRRSSLAEDPEVDRSLW
jgi:hypothetical protein